MLRLVVGPSGFSGPEHHHADERRTRPQDFLLYSFAYLATWQRSGLKCPQSLRLARLHFTRHCPLVDLWSLRDDNDKILRIVALGTDKSNDSETSAGPEKTD